MTTRRLAWILVSLAACESSPSAIPCGDRCVADPETHCIRNDGCSDDADCPSGLMCLADTAINSSCPETAAYPRCAGFYGPPDRDVLVRKFLTRTMNLDLSPPPRAQLLWENPPGAKYVACGVFTCNPAIRKRTSDQDNNADTTPEGMGLKYIANADACMRDLQVTDTSRTSLQLGTVIATRSTCTPVGVYRSAPALLAAACWAYDDYHIVAASELVDLDPKLFGGLYPDIPSAAACGDEFDPCYDSFFHFFGSCVSGNCQPQCTTPQDCELAAKKLFGQPPGDTCGWDCRDVPESLVKVCVRR